MLLLLILLLLWPIDVVVVNIVVVVVNIVVVVIDIVVVVVLLVWPVHLCEDLLRSAVTIGTKHLVHSLNNPENIKIWNMEMNIKIWNMKMNIKIWSIKMLKHLVHSLNNPENIFLMSQASSCHPTFILGGFNIWLIVCVYRHQFHHYHDHDQHMTRFMNIKVLRFHLLTINGAVPIDIVHSKRPAQFLLRVSYQLSWLLWKIIMFGQCLKYMW